MLERRGEDAALTAITDRIVNAQTPEEAARWTLVRERLAQQIEAAEDARQRRMQASREAVHRRSIEDRLASFKIGASSFLIAVGAGATVLVGDVASAFILGAGIAIFSPEAARALTDWFRRTRQGNGDNE